MNEEETKIVAEIAERFERLYTNKNEECVSNYQDVFSCALEVAEWKRQQMTEKAVGWLKEHCTCSKEFLNEFTEAMHENN